MKSFQIAEYSPEERARYSNLQVLRSAAGYYVGSLYTAEDGTEEPGTRDSQGYFDTEVEAEAFLERVQQGDPDARRALRRTGWE